MNQESKPTMDVLKGHLGSRLMAGFACLVVLALMAQLLWSAVLAGVSMLVLMVIVAVGAAMLKAIPLMSQKLENRLLAARKAEARENPIEQLQRFMMEKKQRVAAFKEAVSQIGAQIKSMRDMVAERKRERPNYDATEKEKSIAAMTAAHQALVAKYNAAESALVDLEDLIEDKKFDWKFAQVGQAAMKSLNATSGQDLFDQILADEAFSSVRDNFNKVFADLELEASKINNAKVLTFSDGMTLDMSNIEVRVPVAR